jgi:hypothetical protein
VGLERDPLCLVSKIEELLEWKCSGGLEIENTTEGIGCADHATTLHSQKLALTSPTSGGRSVGIVRLRTKTTELVCTYYEYYVISTLMEIHANFLPTWCYLWRNGTKFCVTLCACSSLSLSASLLHGIWQPSLLFVGDIGYYFFCCASFRCLYFYSAFREDLMYSVFSFYIALLKLSYCVFLLFINYNSFL